MSHAAVHRRRITVPDAQLGCRRRFGVGWEWTCPDCGYRVKERRRPAALMQRWLHVCEESSPTGGAEAS